ncbi:AAA family ATPase [Chitinophaga niabensis]|uniref:AAA family ATPase n=1 Tax=Chitinophaga niabensis TaxID=536979 RepID=UPI0031B9DFB0
MITKLTIHKTASYANRIEISPAPINYFYGNNGSGKTSLSKVIADAASYRDCGLQWKASPLETLVYNRDFVKANFGQGTTLKGIFTLGKDATEARKFIDDKRTEIEVLNTGILGLSATLESKKDEMTAKDKETAEKAWAVKVKYEEFFKEAYKGFMGSTRAFFDKCLAEVSNTTKLLDEERIKDKCKRVYSTSLQEYTPIRPFDYSRYSALENAEILSAKIIGKEDVEIGRLIKQLNNSDWVKEGVGYMEKSEGKCPFCQQYISSQLQVEIESFFDETYNRKIKELNQFKGAYISYVDGLISFVKEIAGREIGIIDFGDLREKIRLLEEQYRHNVSIIDSKIKSPSNPVKLGSLEDVLKDIHVLINGHIQSIETNNSMVKNIGTEKNTLKAEIWRFIVAELEVDLTQYRDAKANNVKAQEKISTGIRDRLITKKAFETEITEKEKQVTSISHTVNEINKILSLFGFTNFRLAEADVKGYYRIIREDGSEAKDTLSEGEYTFITFLYFYQLLKGSTDSSGSTKEKVVVIDDPVSSLDSSILFVVSNLIKSIIRYASEGIDGIKQCFILTHNVYFFKEVTFKGSRDKKLSEEKYWLVQKLNNQTRIISHESNPIQTTYELLWRELDDLGNVNRVTIFNTLRRILEYYFNILGGLKYEDVIKEFEGEEQIICKSLISWINDGSHFINDDLVVYTEPESIEKYLRVFHLIFVKMKQEEHYNMMRKVHKN